MTQTSRPDAAAPERQRDKERTRQEILDVAIREFARNGYSGARVDEIAARTRTTKRMIYYYFGGKEQLYIAALEQAYSTARDAERQLDVEHLDPVAAIRRLTGVPESWKSLYFGGDSAGEWRRVTMNNRLSGRENEVRSLEDFLERAAAA